MKKQTFHSALSPRFLFLSVIIIFFLSINKTIAQQKNNNIAEGAHAVTKKDGINPAPFATTCGDLGGENGWGTWSAKEGYHKFGTANNEYPIFFAPIAPASSPQRFAITSGALADPCSPGGGGPAVPVVAPGFGNASIRLGQPSTNGITGNCANNGAYPAPGGNAQGNGCSEQLTCQFTVNAADTNFVYAFAIFVENPPNGHTITQAPFAEIYILGPLGDTVKCSHQKYTADLTGGVLPGFYQSTCAATSQGAIITYKPWTVVGVNLGKYVGQQLTVVITNTDCALGGHCCWSYWDFKCPPVAGSANPFCAGQQTTITGPPSDPTNPYTYTWYQNHHIYTGLPSSSSQTITPTPLSGDTFAVLVHQASGCDFWMPFMPQVLLINANFTLVNNCGTVTLTDSSKSTTGGTINAWNWSFPGGNPSSSTSQNPTVIYNTSGTHSITLTITSSLGCTSTKVLVVTTGIPVAAFTTGPVCLGTTTQFSDQSTASSGDPLSIWDWNFGDGTANAATQSPSHIYATPGTYSVTEIVTTKGGCKDTIVKTVTVNAIPVAAFTSNTVCAGIQTQITDGSTPPAGGSITWQWSLPGGNPSSSTVQNPAVSYTAGGTYNVTLIVTSQAGCKDTVVLPVKVNALPLAAFSSNTVCAGNITSLINSSVPPAGGSIATYSWNFSGGNPSSSTSQNPAITFPAGVYNATLVVTTPEGCVSNIVHPVTVRGLPIAGFNSNSPCQGNLTSLLDGSASPSGDPITSWSWSMAGGSPASSSNQNTSTTYGAPGTYTVTLTVTTQGGCKDTTNKPVLIYPPPVANLSGSGVGCAPLCVTNYTDLSTTVAGNNIINWQWSFPGGTPSSSTQPNPPSVCYNTPGSYGASLIVTTVNGCKDSIAINPLVTVYGWPTANFCIEANPLPVSDPEFKFCDQWSSDVVQWVWTFGDGDSSFTIANPAHSYSAVATANDFYHYTVCLNVQNQHGCWDSICHVVDLLPEFEFYIPNCFTPNGDGANELFFGKCRGVKDYNIWLFDRWGNQIWDCHYTGKNTDFDMPGGDGMSSTCKWDGIVVKGGMDMSGNSGLLAQEDVYVWKVKLTDIFDKKHSYIGHVSIVK